MKWNQELYERVSLWVEEHREEMLEALERLVVIPSVACSHPETLPYGSECRRAMDEMSDIAREKGFKGVNREYYMEEFWLDKKEKNIGIWSHLDVLPEGQGWEYPAFAMTRTKGYVVGRGVLDDKGPAIAGLYAVLALKELEIPMNQGVSLFAGSCEEYGMSDADYYRDHYECPDLNLVVDSRFPVNHGEKGNLTVKIKAERPFEARVTAFSAGFSPNAVADAARLGVAVENRELLATAKGIAAHAANPQGGKNAISMLCLSLLGESDAACGGISVEDGIRESLTENDREILHALAIFAEGFEGRGFGVECSDDKLGSLTCVSSMLELSDGRPVLTVNIRYPLETCQKKLLAKIEEKALEHGFRLISSDGTPACYMNPDTEAVSRLMNVYNTMLQKEEKPFTIGGGTYARKLPNSIGFGFRLPVEDDISQVVKPGHGGIHSPDETMKITHFMTGTKLLIMGLAALGAE